MCWYAGDAERLSESVPVEPYDLIYSFGAVHHTPDPGRVVAEMRRYARPGTTLKIMVYHRRSWKVLWILLRYGQARFWKASELTARHSEAETGCPVTHTFTKNEAMRLLKDYKVISVMPEHIFPYCISDYICYVYKKVWYFRWMGRPLFRALERRFGWHLLITAEPC